MGDSPFAQYGGVVRLIQRQCVARCLSYAFIAILVVAPGCSRSRYRLRADRDAFQVLCEKSRKTPWVPPAAFQVVPGPASRLFDPSPVEFPQLPPVAPRLYTYEIPPLHSDPPSEPRLRPENLPAASAIHPATHQDPTESRQGAANETDSVVLPGPTERAPDSELSPITIPASAWQSIPDACKARVLEFDSAQGEFVRTFGRPPVTGELNSARKLTLEQIVELAQINSREYQTQKERLYRTALRLTFERFQFELKFSASPGANRGELDYRHTRIPGIGTVNTLRLPASVQVDRVLFTGGDFLARLANDIVLTFNGPQGFAADFSSELFAQVTQTVFQRDIRFESLTQADRNVIYAARDLVRFRKELFTTLATQYYNLLRTYRQVEIDSLNYFTLVRALAQRGEEYRVGLAPRVQVDQIEQNTLAGVTSLIGTCNRLERELDTLKLTMGAPTETLLNLDLTELANLTLADETAIATQLVQRVRVRLRSLARQGDVDRHELLNLAIELVTRMQNAVELHGGAAATERTELAALQLRLRLSEARLSIRQQRELLAIDAADPMASPARLLQRNLAVISANLVLLERQQQAATLSQAAAETARDIAAEQAAFAQRAEEIEAQMDAAFDQLEIPRIAELVNLAERLRADTEQAGERAAQALALDRTPLDQPALQDLVEQLETFHNQGEQSLERRVGGLAPVEISFDDAMFTALLLRLSLMNQRGLLADEWRQVKLAADNLKSILNLTASQRISDFNLNDSETRLNVRFEPPLNRFAQRNAFRESILDYQQARRQLMELEDEIKFDVRNNLRDLSLSKQQYDLGVASAALAFERVAGTRQQLRLGVAGVQARDFLEAQTAYASALSTVAARHLGYVISRMQLFLDLELLDVDGSGFWPDLRDPHVQPTPTYEPPHGVAFQPYGPLAPRVHYSREMRQMLHVPYGEPAIFTTSDAPAARSSP